MNSDWMRHSTAELIAQRILVIGDGYRAKNSELSAEGLLFARAGNINNGFHFEDADRFPETDIDKVGDKISRPGDVVFTSKGTVGRFAFVRADTPTFVYAPQLCYWRSLDSEGIWPTFLYYWMHSREFWLQASGVKGQTDMADYVSLGDQRRMYITLPPIREQRAIAAVLGSLDDKIELNRRMNRTLEQMATAIFKAWFVDFEPVKAKAAGATSYPTVPREVFDALPTEFTDSPLGPIPEGWTNEVLDQLIEIEGGGTPKTTEPTYWGGDIPWFSVKDAPSEGDVWVVDTEKTITQLGIENSSTKLFPKETTIISARGTVGRLALVGVPMAMNQSCYGIRGATGISDFFVYFCLKTAIDDLQRHSHGSVFSTITRDTFKGIRLTQPPSDLTVAFDAAVRPLLEQMLNGRLESRTLAAIRDALLPKLLSGEIRVGAVAQVVEDVA